MKVLVACEYSGVVRDAFIAEGHDAISCDFLPTESPGPHIQGDAIEAMKEPWDLVIAHPPCQYLSNAGCGALAHNPERIYDVYAGWRFFALCQKANAPLVAVENPLPHTQAFDLMGKPSQLVRPWWFGDASNKAICLWLKGVPGLLATTPLPKTSWTKPSKAWTGASAKDRSRTYPGIAAAMAKQWGCF